MAPDSCIILNINTTYTYILSEHLRSPRVHHIAASQCHGSWTRVRGELGHQGGSQPLDTAGRVPDAEYGYISRAKTETGSFVCCYFFKRVFYY